jgi:class 3 adenylate cyclase
MPRSLRTHVIMDLRGYGRILLNGGEAHAAVLMRAYERLVRRALGTKTFEVDHIADTFHLAFPTPALAVRTTTAIADALQRHNKTHPDLEIPVSFGMDTGTGVGRGTKFVGSAPVLASRLCHRARPGQILVSESVFALLRTAGLGQMRDLGVWRPKEGQAVHMYEVRAPDPNTDGTTEVERFLTALLFEDIVGSTTMSAKLGDQRWGQLIEQHHAVIRDELNRHHGMEIDTAGDGFYATFDAPSRAVDCAFALRDRLRRIGIDVRAGIHAGECEVVAGKVGGIAVSIGARVMSEGGAGDVLVSQTVRDLLVGGGYTFTERGRSVLKGVPGEWTIYRVGAARARSEPPA